jgi:hypothetical protein
MKSIILECSIIIRNLMVMERFNYISKLQKLIFKQYIVGKYEKGGSTMKKFISIPVVESSLYIFGGHMHTVPAKWSFFEQKHQAFELMCVLEGKQTTELEGIGTYTYGPGDVMIISPGTVHTNYNASDTDDMTYITFHFNFEGLKLKSEIISRVSNIVIDAKDELAKKSIATSKEIIKCSEEKDLDKEEADIKIQILMLKYLYNLKQYLAKNRFETNKVFQKWN